jgi:hypothetical protein
MTTTQVSATSKDHTAVEVSVSSYGAGRPGLLLHGGATSRWRSRSRIQA